MKENRETIPTEDSENALYPENVNNSLQNNQDGQEESAETSPAPEVTDTEGSEKSSEEKEEEKDYSRIASEDLAEIKKLFPEFSELEDIRQLNNALRFAELRDAGLSVSEALAATNMDRMLISLTHRMTRDDGKSHLRSAVPITSATQKNRMSADELHSARELFGSLSDRELERLYKRATS